MAARLSRSLVVLLLALHGASLLACASSGSSEPGLDAARRDASRLSNPETGVHDGSSPDGAPTSDGGAPIDASAMDGGPPAPSRGGFISITHRTSGGTAEHRLRGYLGDFDSEASASDVAPGCTATPVAGCIVIRCQENSEALVSESAGRVTISDDFGNELVAAEPMTEGYSTSGAGRAFEPIDTLRIRAVGAALPAFEVTLDAPAMPDIVSPTAFSRTAGATLTWTSAPFASTVIVTLTTLLSDPPLVVRCSGSGSANTLTVPAAALADVPAGPLTYAVTASNRAWVTTGSRGVLVLANETRVVASTATD